MLKMIPVVLSAMAGLLLAVSRAEAQGKLPAAEVRQIAEEATMYAFPMVMNYGVVYETYVDKASSQYKCGFNELSNTARVFTPKDTSVVTPNSDTPYSFFCADLRAEPVVFSIPKIEEGRYFPCSSSTFTRAIMAMWEAARRAMWPGAT